jgi:hypothetical protein
MKRKLIASTVISFLAVASSITGVALAAGTAPTAKSGKLPGVALTGDRHHRHKHHCDGDHDRDDRNCRCGDGDHDRDDRHCKCHYPPSQADLQLAVTYVNGHAVFSGRERCDRDGVVGDTVTISVSSGHGSCSATAASGAYSCSVTAADRRVTAQTHSGSGASSNTVAVRAPAARSS